MLAATVLFAALVWVRASGVRGSDQYGYVADVASLIRGTGNQTNLVFPVVLDHGDPLPRPFMHNVIVTYLPVLPGLLVGAYHGWIVTNILASLLTAYLVYRTVRRFTPHIHALLAASGYLGLPLTVWQATQPLAEATTAPLVALATYLYVTAGTSYTRWLVLTGTAVLLFYARHTFVVLLVVVPLAYLVEQGVTKAKTLVRALGLLVVALSLGAVQHVLFPPYHDFPYAEAFNGTVMEAHNMGHYFSPASGDVGLSTLLGKLERALRIQSQGTPRDSCSFGRSTCSFWYSSIKAKVVPAPLSASGSGSAGLHGASWRRHRALPESVSLRASGDAPADGRPRHRAA